MWGSLSTLFLIWIISCEKSLHQWNCKFQWIQNITHKYASNCSKRHQKSFECIVWSLACKISFVLCKTLWNFKTLIILMWVTVLWSQGSNFNNLIFLSLSFAGMCCHDQNCLFQKEESWLRINPRPFSKFSFRLEIVLLQSLRF